ncbi:MAG: hypothetical protein JNK82_38635 [Myxococcaceae bacterium]|nr:hypothetical protein [Myxococcaceae bacterium]
MFGFFAGCSCPGPAETDAGTDSGVVDSGVFDSGFADAGVPDSGFVDSGVFDSGFVDAGPRDAGSLADAGTLRCLSVYCVGDNTCSLDDGECRCNGVACQPGDTCACPAGQPGCLPTERACVTSMRCDGVICAGGSTCDFSDGQCKCTGAGGPVCSDTQVCGAARPAQCSGVCGAPCDDGSSCDPDDLTCKCGGRGGAPCGAGEVCVSTSSQWACKLPCAPVGGSCPLGQGCFIDTRPSLDVAYCAFPSGLRGEGELCTHPTQCFEPSTGIALHCVGLSAQVPVGVCRQACIVPGSLCPGGKHCEPNADVRDAGFCVP